MTKLLQNAATYRMAILIGALFSINALATAIVISLLNNDWKNLSATSQFLVVVTVVQNWTGTMLAFFNKTLARIEQGKSPIETGDTQQFAKSALTGTGDAVIPKP
jgi:hypothetical protein